MFYTCYYVCSRSETEGGAFGWLLELRAVLILVLILIQTLIIVQWRTGSWESHRRLRRTWWWVKSWNVKPFLIILLPTFQSLTLKADRWCGMCAISCRCHRFLTSHINMTFVLFCIKRLRWSRGSVLAFGTQVRVFKPERSRRIFNGQ